MLAKRLRHQSSCERDRGSMDEKKIRLSALGQSRSEASGGAIVYSESAPYGALIISRRGRTERGKYQESQFGAFREPA